MTKRGKKRLALLLIVGALLGVGIVAGKTIRDSQRQKRIAEAKQVGEAARSEGDHRTAVNELGFYLIQTSRLNEGQPIDGETWLEWADSRRRVVEENGDHLALAINGARNAAALMPDDPRPNEMLLELYAQTGQLTERLDVAEALLEEDPAHPEANTARALSHWRLGDEEAALEAAREMAARRPGDLRAHELLIELTLLAGGEAQEIRTLAERAVSRHPDDLGFTLLGARAATAVGDIESARAHAERAASMPIEEADQFRMLLAMLDALAMEEQSRSVERRELEAAGPGDERLAIAAERAWRLSQPERAKSYFDAEALDPSSASDVFLGWWAMLSIGDQDAEAVRSHPAIEELRSRASDAAVAWREIIDAYLAMREKDWGAARDHLAAALASEERNDIAEYLLGEAERSLGERRAAIDRWKRLAFRDGRWVSLRLSLAEALLGEGEAVEAFSYAAGALGNAPNQSVAAPTLARAAVGVLEEEAAPSDMVATAVEFLEACRETYAEVDEMMATVARGLAAQQRAEEARSVARRLIERDASLSAESIAALLRLNRQEDWGLAAEIRGLGEKRDLSPALAFVLAVESADRGEAEEGLRSLRRAAEEADASQARAYERRIALYMDLIGHEEALDRLRALAEQNPRSSRIQIDLLESRAAWRDPGVVKEAIGRLKSTAGEESLTWRLYEARRLLRFDPTEANAAQVEILLDPLMNAADDDPTPATLVAEARLISGDADRAIDALVTAVQIAPDDPRLYPRLIGLLQQQGRAAAAERFLADFFEIEDLAPGARRRRAGLLATQGLWEQAAADYEALGEEQNEQDLLALASVRLKQGRVAQAGEIFEDLISRESPSMAAIQGAAQHYAATGRMDKARETLAMAEDDPPGRRARAAAYFWEQQGEAERAGEKFVEFASARGTGAAWAEVVSFHLRERDFDAAQRAVERGLEADPDHQGLTIASRTIDLSRGGELSDQAMSDLVGGLGAGAASEAAEETLEALLALQKSPEDLDAHVARLEEITEDFPTFFPAWRMLAIALVQQERMEEALDVATQAGSVLPTDARPRRLATEILMMRGERERALAAARQWRERTLEDPIEADVTIASLEQSLGRTNAALGRLEQHRDRIVSQADRRPSRLVLLAQTLAADGQTEEAAALLLPLASEDPVWAARSMRVAIALATRPGEAFAWVERVGPLLSEEDGSAILLGQTLYEVGMATGDPRFFEAVVRRLEPRASAEGAGATFAALTAASREALGEESEAERLYRLAASGKDAPAAVLNNLAYLLLKIGASAEEAYDLAVRAVEEQPRNATFLDTLGVALLALGRHEEAEEVFERALRLTPSEPGLLIGLAEARLGQGEEASARATLDRADAALAASGSLPPEVRERYERLRESLSERMTSSAER